MNTLELNLKSYVKYDGQRGIPTSPIFDKECAQVNEKIMVVKHSLGKECKRVRKSIDSKGA